MATQQISQYGVSVANSTTTALGSAATFTGEWELVPQLGVMCTCKSDASGTLYFDFSVDGVNSDSTFPPNGFSVAANISEFHTAVKGGRWFRVRYVNDSDAQTYFRLSTQYGDYRQGNLPVNATISNDDDATVVRTISPEIDLAIGRVGGISTGTKFGRNPDIGTGTAPEDLWAGGGLYTGQPASYTPETVDVYSSDVNDTSAGTGARTVRISGLKTSTSTDYETEDITLNGTTHVTSTNTWWRVNRVKVLTAGSGGTNAGVINVEATTTTANVFAKMPIGFAQTTIGAYTVPFGKSILVKRVRVSITRATGAAGSATITMRVRDVGGVYRAVRVFDIQTGDSVSYTEFAGELFGAGADIKMTIESVSDNSTICDGAFEYLLISDAN